MTAGGRPLAEVYRRFAGAETGSVLRARASDAVGRSERALRAVGTAPPSRRHPALVLAALRDLALAGRAPALAEACAARDGDAAGRAAVDALVRMTDAVVGTAVRRRTPVRETGRAAVLHPAVAEAASRAGADAIGLVGVGHPVGFDLLVDRVGIAYGGGPTLGDPSSPVQLRASVVGDRQVPARELPAVLARVVVSRHPVDVTDPDDVRWLRACVWPDEPERPAALEAELALAATAPPRTVAGSVPDALPEALALVPAGALPVVTTTWALSRLPRDARARFRRRLEDAAADRPVAWVSVEGVGVAPGVPTLGDRPASGHSTIGLTLLDRAGARGEVLGRCWARGRLLSWPAGTTSRQRGSGSQARTSWMRSSQ